MENFGREITKTFNVDAKVFRVTGSEAGYFNRYEVAVFGSFNAAMISALLSSVKHGGASYLLFGQNSSRLEK
jgi:hypothetical protein